jgi:esterase/lipase superfamily enzyme
MSEFRFSALFTLAPLLIGLLGGCASSGSAPPVTKPAQEKIEASARQVEIFYATDRAPVPAEGEYYGPDRGSPALGIATVAIPPHHQIGHHEQPSVFKFEWSPDERKHIAVTGITPLGREAFFDQLERAVYLSPDRKLLVFVHGYNTRFAEATRLLAQFATDLKFNGPSVLFSWPSQAGVTSYMVDETNIEWAQPHLVQLLDDLIDRTSARQIYVVAHSMGSRVLTRAYNTLASDRQAHNLSTIGEMILVAPDIDADVFRDDISPRLARSGIHVTLYASSADRALLASKAFHGHPRAGDSGEGLVIVPGVETINASEASGGLLGHSYFAEDRRIMEDIFAILQTGQRAQNRFGLEAVDANRGRYWTFRK